MCGILAIINKNTKKIDNTTLAKMMSAVNYRGPDDSGFVVFENNVSKQINIKQKQSIGFDLLLAHNRLSIIDLSIDGRQPLTTIDLQQRYWIVFNGEIYNYIEIREELIKKGYKFHTKTDTEVALKAYIEWGDHAQNKFNGMWAILVYDVNTKNIWVSRDRLGKKPLYYYENEDYLIFSSEIKQILPLVQLKENVLENRAIMLTNYRGHLKETSFKEVFRFPFSHSLTFNIFNILYNFTRYWQLSYDRSIVYERVKQDKLEDYSKEFYRILYDAVALRLRSDTPVGITLSGGIDSNSILYILNDIIGNKYPINAYTSVFNNADLADLNELDLVKESLRKIPCNHTAIETNYLDIEQFVSVYREKTWAYDFPVPAIGFSGYSVYKKIHETGLKVVIEGQGADELLSGYDSCWFYFFRKFRMYKLLEAGKYLGSGVNLNKIKCIFGGVFSNTIFSKYSYEKLYKHYMKKRANVLDIEFSNELYEYMLYRDEIDKYSQIKEYNLNDALIDELNSHLPYHLYTGDRDSMMFSVESRLPYLDYRLLEFVIGLPENYKMHNGLSKYISRVAFNYKIPDNILWNKKKLGYPDATQYYVQKDKNLNNLVTKLLNNHNPYLDYKKMIATDFRSVEHILSDLFFKEQFLGKKLEF